MITSRCVCRLANFLLLDHALYTIATALSNMPYRSTLSSMIREVMRLKQRRRCSGDEDVLPSLMTMRNMIRQFVMGSPLAAHFGQLHWVRKDRLGGLDKNLLLPSTKASPVHVFEICLCFSKSCRFAIICCELILIDCPSCSICPSRHLPWQVLSKVIL